MNHQSCLVIENIVEPKCFKECRMQHGAKESRNE
jgi:hypothetical protein